MSLMRVRLQIIHGLITNALIAESRSADDPTMAETLASSLTSAHQQVQAALVALPAPPPPCPTQDSSAASTEPPLATPGSPDPTPLPSVAQVGPGSSLPSEDGDVR